MTLILKNYESLIQKYENQKRLNDTQKSQFLSEILEYEEIKQNMEKMNQKVKVLE